MNMKSKHRNKIEVRNSVSVAFTAEGWEDYHHWRAVDPAIFEVINALIRECCRTPFKGTGKPEPLKGDLSGYWSRRITREHRLVYFYEGGQLTVLQCRFHYD
ncbi:Txe/YoeB family addiction module toxin [Pseudomonas putida]|uniref:Txe/YoeB family addiction module toxin n=1 Tax=Pseudomonas putida TaxID=303 RepID=UPI00125F1968|nr:Txe/YoeB family addiction module toxin [Pseudomonas putida]KAB5621093.1 Txe/YoeB family addiction module toxin [Pseudomonas putida]HEK1688211.1 Txe/YoeB family addiction module toxin [Pseudomonas putida]